ncbi:MAG: LURP-one-related/scramblase family protein, partial [Sarcina sp.]
MSNSYYVKERMLAFGAKFDVYNDNDKIVFYVEADKFDIGKNISIYKSEGGRKLLYMKQQIRIGAHKYEVFDENNMHVSTIQKELMTPIYNISGQYGYIVMESNSIWG